MTIETTTLKSEPDFYTIVTAVAFAAKKHAGQSWGSLPYLEHVQDVYSRVLALKINDVDILAACLLHDTLEDTNATPEEILSLFGERALDLVARVTEPKNMPRRERHAVTYPKIRENPDAILIKLADRVSNVVFSQKEGSGMFEMYRKEYQNFCKHLRRTPEDQRIEEYLLWRQLDALLATRVMEA